MSVTFEPTEEGGRYAYLNINDNAAGSPQQVTLQGEGMALRVTPAKLNFGKVGVHTISPQQLIEVTNTSTQVVSMKIAMVWAPTKTISWRRMADRRSPAKPVAPSRCNSLPPRKAP